MYGNSERYAGEEENGITSQKMNRPIIFLGYMGAGKTTVGKAFAQDTGRRFYDLDWYIESRRHRTVKQIFDEVGEDGFRRIERNMLHEVAEFENVVVSCGGGTPCFFDNMDYMNSRAVTVYLKATPDVLFEHLKMGRTVRPLLLGKTPDEVKAFVRQQLEVREPFYSKALHTFDVSLLDNHVKIKNTVAQLRELLCI